MVRLSKWVLILLTLVCGAGEVLAASSAEDKAFRMATGSFQFSSWDVAELAFQNFREKFPASTRIPEAVLYQAQSMFHNRQFAGAAALLAENQGRAGTLADQYLFWTGKSHFENENYPAAARTFAQLTERDSPLRLDATLWQARAYARQADWPRVIGLLEPSTSIFQQTRLLGTATESTGWGLIYLGEAYLAQGNSTNVLGVLQSLGEQPLGAELSWRRQYLQGRWQRGEGRLDEALITSSNLVATINVTNRAEGVAFEAGIRERLKQLDEAIAGYQKNLGEGVPLEQQRRALLKITELYLAQDKLSNAVQTLEKYLARTNAPGVDLALLTLGELQLKQYLAPAGNRTTNGATGSATTVLVPAIDPFQQVLTRFPDSPFVGKALLGKGWCLWAGEKFGESAEAFRLAMERLPFSEDQAVARFKWADSQYRLKDFAGAITNYDFLVVNYASLPELRDLIERALYQTVRAALDGGDFPSATNALQHVVDWYPTGFLGPVALLLSGQGLSQQRDPAGARALFAEFEKRYPDSPLLPEVRLAMARTFEQEQNWEPAIGIYDAWIGTFATNAKLPVAEFWRASDTANAGGQTNALELFSSFVTKYPSNELAARAEWWIGGYYFNSRESASLDPVEALNKAEAAYQSVNKSGQASDLFYEAQIMAGQVALARRSSPDAFRYFTNLYNDPKCPMDFKLQAAFGAGDVLAAQAEPTDAQRKLNLEEAIRWLDVIPRLSPTNAMVPKAWARMGDFYKELGAQDPQRYANAIEYYQRVTNGTAAVRGQAKVGLGIVAEKRADLTNGVEQMSLRIQALANYEEVFQELRFGEKPDLFWSNRAGLEAARLAESLHKYETAIKIYQQIKDLLPPLGPPMERRISRAQEKSK